MGSQGMRSHEFRVRTSHEGPFGFLRKMRDFKPVSRAEIHAHGPVTSASSNDADSSPDARPAPAQGLAKRDEFLLVLGLNDTVLGAYGPKNGVIACK